MAPPMMSEQEDETSLLMKGVSHGSNDMKVNGVSHGSNDIKVNIKSSEMRMQRIENEENENAKIWNIPKLFIGWLQSLRDSFGAPFMTVVIIVYGVSQGYVGTVKGLATAYYWKDVQKLQPASTQAFQALVGMPWNIKPIYGLIIDTFPIAGFQRWPYLAISGILGTCSLWLLAMLSGPTPLLAALLMAVTALSTAFPDVVVDAAMAEQSRNVPALASDLQSLSWGSLSVGGLIGCAVSGASVHFFGPRGSFLLISLAPLMLLVAARALPEKRLPRDPNGARFRNMMNTIKLFLQTLRDPNFWRPALFIYLSQSLCPDISEAMFYWFTDPVVGPGFSEQFLGFVSGIAYVAMVGGIALFNCWFRFYTIRNMFFWPQVAYCTMGLLDMIIVCRWNVRVGIPDHMFVLGDEAVADVVGRLQLMPVMVLSARLCPAGAEGTVFAFLMSVSNFGGTCASWAGAALLRHLRVTRLDYTHLWLAVLLRALLRLVPLLFLPLLLPRGTLDDVRVVSFASSPASDPIHRGDDADDDGGGDDERRRFVPLPSPTSHELALLATDPTLVDSRP